MKRNVLCATKFRKPSAPLDATDLTLLLKWLAKADANQLVRVALVRQLFATLNVPQPRRETV